VTGDEAPCPDASAGRILKVRGSFPAPPS